LERVQMQSAPIPAKIAHTLTVADHMGGPVAPAPEPQDPLQPVMQHLQGRLNKDYEKDANPYGSPQNHPGVFGKIAHALNVATGGENRRMDEEQGIEKRIGETVGDQSKNAYQGAETAHLNAETPEVAPNAESERGERAVDTATKQQALDMGPSLATAYAHRVNQVIQEGGDPSTDATVQHLHSAIEDLQKSGSAKAFQHVAGTSGGKDMYANYDPNKGEYTDLAGNVLTDFKPKDKAMQGALGQYAPVRLLTSLMQTAYKDNPALLPVLKPLMSKIMAQYGGEGAADVMAEIPEGQPHASSGSAIGLSMPEAPTGATRSRGQFAGEVLPTMQEAGVEVQKLGDKLGPFMGRISDLLTSKIGAYGPEFSGLQSDLHNIATGWGRLHGNSVETMKQFTDDLNASKDPANLAEKLRHYERQAKIYKTGGTGRPDELPKDPAQSGPPQGADVQVKGHDGKMYWGNSKTKQVLGPVQ